MTDQTVFPGFPDAESRGRYMAAYDDALSQWPVAYESLRLRTDIGETHVIASGPAGASPLILLPSFAGTALAWRPNIAALSRNHRVYAIDTVGQTGRSVITRSMGREDDYVRWLEALMDQLGVAAAPVVGCSFGGFIAASLAVLAPQRVTRLVLIGPIGVFAMMSPLVLMRMMARRLPPWLRPLFGAGKAMTLNAAEAPLHPEDDAWRALMAATMAAKAKITPMHPRVYRPAELARITAPTLLLIGEYEQMNDPRQTLERARSAMPGVTAELVAGADHIAAMAQPHQVNASIIQFLGTRP